MRKPAVICLLSALLATPGFAAFLTEKIDEGVYFVSYERGKILRGGVLDTSNKARKKLERRSHEFCLEEGYQYLKFPTLGEIARDEELRLVWSLAAGDHGRDTSDMAGDVWSGTTTTHKSRSILLLSKEERDGYTKCKKK